MNEWLQASTASQRGQGRTSPLLALLRMTGSMQGISSLIFLHLNYTDQSSASEADSFSVGREIHCIAN
jgi:hypothetical protein